jgi:hypothetical protein
MIYSIYYESKGTSPSVSDVDRYVIIRKLLDPIFNIQNDSKLLSGFPWPINVNPDNNLESLCTSGIHMPMGFQTYLRGNLLP